MNGSTGVAAAMIGLGALSLCAGAIAVAEQGELGEMVELRSAGNDDAVAAQKRIDTISDETDNLLGQFRTTLKQIDSINEYNEQILKLIDSQAIEIDRKSTRLNSSHVVISYAVFCLKKKKK